LETDDTTSPPIVYVVVVFELPVDYSTINGLGQQEQDFSAELAAAVVDAIIGLGVSDPSSIRSVKFYEAVDGDVRVAVTVPEPESSIIVEAVESGGLVLQLKVAGMIEARPGRRLSTHTCYLPVQIVPLRIC